MVPVDWWHWPLDGSCVVSFCTLACTSNLIVIISREPKRKEKKSITKDSRHITVASVPRGAIVVELSNKLNMLSAAPAGLLG